MSIHYQSANAFGVAAYPGSPQIVIPFQPVKITIRNEDGTAADDIFFSLDGVTDHGHLPGGTAIEIIQRVQKIWLRRGLAGADPTTVSVTAES